MKREVTTGSNRLDQSCDPQYGGTLNLRIEGNPVHFDPYDHPLRMNILSGWLETLHVETWTMTPKVQQVIKNHMVECSEFTDPSTYIVHLRKGIHWQDIPPLNGREFTADDVAYHYDRLYGLGHGFTKSGPGAILHFFRSLISVTATDKYTVVFKWKEPNQEIMRESIQESGCVHAIEPREAVEKWGGLSDWHHAIGTGPFILKDFVPGSEVTLVRNPNYWGHDDCYPQNQLPYIDTLKILIIPDNVAALDALRTGKIDVLDGISSKQAKEIRKTNPEILQVSYPSGNAICIDPRNDRTPFNDIRVRKAMQMAIDLPTICRTYYGNTCLPYPCSVTSNYKKGWGFPYEEWPQDLKEEYGYNPTEARQLLADAGYPNGFKTNIVAEETGDMDLLKIVKSYFTDVGIDMEIRTMDPTAGADYINGRKHDQLAQRGVGGKIGRLFVPPVHDLGRLATGQAGNHLMVSDPLYDAFYTKAMSTTSFEGIMQILRDCSEYVARQHFDISLLQPMEHSLYQPWFKGYTGQHSSISGSLGPQLLFFYGARFWIDQNLKQKMGH